MRSLPVLTMALQVALAVTPSAAFALERDSATLTVHVTGFKNAEGRAIINLFCEGQDVMKLKQAYRRANSAIENGEATFTFSDLPAGDYAISVFHDLNDNGELDHSMGVPAEPLAFSNGFHLSLFSGLPTFEKLKFSFGPKTPVVEIRFK